MDGCTSIIHKPFPKGWWDGEWHEVSPFNTLHDKICQCNWHWEPMAVPKVCWYHSPWFATKVASRQNFRSRSTSSGDKAVGSSSDSSARNLTTATWQASSTGTLVKRETASPMIIWSKRKTANSVESLMKEGVLPTSGDSRLTKCLVSWQRMNWLQGTSGLWIFGRPVSNHLSSVVNEFHSKWTMTFFFLWKF